MGLYEAMRQIGSPAWAGIDPFRDAAGAHIVWLPRVGGDRPSGTDSAFMLQPAPPRGRG